LEILSSKGRFDGSGKEVCLATLWSFCFLPFFPPVPNFLPLGSSPELPFHLSAFILPPHCWQRAFFSLRGFPAFFPHALVSQLVSPLFLLPSRAYERTCEQTTARRSHFRHLFFSLCFRFFVSLAIICQTRPAASFLRSASLGVLLFGSTYLFLSFRRSA